MDRAKQLFLEYNGSHFHMDREGDGAEYESYHVSRETESRWAKEYISIFLESDLQGKKAFRGYSASCDLIVYIGQGSLWDVCLYYPLRSENLDDVTVLFMLQYSYRMAEREARKNRLLQQQVEAYLKELNSFRVGVLKRIENGTETRSSDYTMNEFSDPVYTADYLRKLENQWRELLF